MKYGFELEAVPLELTCSLCRRPHNVTLRLPPDVGVAATATFTCRHCTGTDRFGAPQDMDRVEWIAICAAAGWRCSGCGSRLDFGEARNFTGHLVCERCRTRAYRAGRIETAA
jgi:hypothetical protein